MMNDKTKGWLNGVAGMLIFSGSAPATRAAVMSLDPFFVTAARATLAALLGAAMLLAIRAPLPRRADIKRLLITAAGVVLGFPLLSGLALRHISSGRSVVFIGLLPMATALFGVLRGGERPPLPFWLFALLGAGVIGLFALARGGDASPQGDLLMLIAIVVCGLGYAEGGVLARHLGGVQVICWALVLSLPLMLPAVLLTFPKDLSPVTVTSWLGFFYVTLFSMFIGFVFWYRGLALGGIAAISQVQLLMPLFGLAWSAFLLHEAVSWSMLWTTAGVILCVAGARRFSHPAQVLRSLPAPAALGEEME